MRTSPYGEDDRAVLTNGHIKTDLKKTGNSHLLAALTTPLLGFLVFLFCMLAKSVQSESSVLFWIAMVMAAVIAASAVYILVASVCKAAPYLRAASGNRFFVTPDTLVGKQEGHVITLAAASMAREYPSLPGPARFERRNRYQFTTATCKVPLQEYHFAFDRNLATNEGTLFRHSEPGDAFWLVSLKPGKPVKIYPQKRFRYTDSSPL